MLVGLRYLSDNKMTARTDFHGNILITVFKLLMH